jgi:hypothetical protein
MRNINSCGHSAERKRRRRYTRIWLWGLFLLCYAPPSLDRLFRFYWQGIKRTIRLAPKQAEWSIGIYRGQSPFHLLPAQHPYTPVLTRHHIIDVPAEGVADPFMIRIGNVWYMFFEVINLESKKGEIGLATSEDGLKWDYKQVVLKEPFHLSYPYVFEWEGEIFMVPESQQTRSIRLYRADDFPYGWSFVTTLSSGKAYSDPSLVRFQERWWLFACNRNKDVCRAKAESLHLFVADDLIGPWHEHPCSPVVRRNAKIARPGGRIIRYQDRLFRYAQDCAQTYGRQVHAVEIIELTPERYTERIVSEGPIVKPTDDGWNEDGMHHVDAYQSSDGSWLACVDGMRTVQFEKRRKP